MFILLSSFKIFFKKRRLGQQMSKFKTILKLIKKSNAIQILSDTIPMEINLLYSNLLKIYFCYYIY